MNSKLVFHDPFCHNKYAHPIISEAVEEKHMIEFMKTFDGYMTKRTKNQKSVDRTKFLQWIEKCGPVITAPVIVKQFLSVLREDLYPPEYYERIFGVEMIEGYTPRNLHEFPVGKLTYGVFQTLNKNDYINEINMVDALYQGKLPKFFEEKVLHMYDEYLTNCRYETYMTKYVTELIKRGFSSISWDLEAHRLLTKKVDFHQEFTSKQVQGLRIDGENMTSELIQVDSSFEKCPIATAAQIPLFVKRLPVKGRKLENDGRYIICRMMSEPDTGVPPLNWSFDEAFGPTPPVLIGRSDGISFTEKDWKILDDFVVEMLSVKPRNVGRKDLVEFAHRTSSQANIILEVLFPKGSQLKIVGLKSAVMLNEKVGEATGCYENGRVGIRVAIDGLDKIVAVKPDNLTMVLSVNEMSTDGKEYNVTNKKNKKNKKNKNR